MIYFLTWCVVLIAVVLLYFKQRYSTFRRHGIRHIKAYPLVGNTGRTLMRRIHFADDVKDLYNSFPEDRFVGRYDFVTELIVLRDVELIKQVTVKDFEHFLDHRTNIGEHDALFGRNLLSLRGQEWKDMRSTLSPAFTSSKIRLMVPFMVEVGNQMIRSLKKKIKDSDVGYLDVDCKDLTTRYGNDVIASCAFGLKVDSHTEENNEFYANGKKAMTFSFRQIMMFLLISNFPSVAKWFKLKIFAESSNVFFKSLVLNTMKDREERNIIRPDMIHLLMEAKKGKLSHEEKSSELVDADAGFAVVEESSVGTKKITREWTENDLIAQAVLFFLAGFDTVSTGMSFLLHELAVNTEVQERLVQEIREHDARNGGKFDFNSIQKMTYMDMVVSEVLRLWPPGVLLDRLCIKDYNLGKPNKDAAEDFIIRKNSGIIIPVYPIHRDPQYYENPNKFDPERFSEENKHKIQPNTYFPFGSGPRNCIGSRFALCEMKVMTYQILQHFTISPCEKTCIPAELSLENFNIMLKGGHWLRFKVRT